MFNLFRDHSEKPWIIIYLTFQMPKAKLFARKLERFLEDVGWKLFSERNLTTIALPGTEVHLAPRYDATISPKALIRVHYKVTRFAKLAAGYLKDKNPEYRTEVSVRGRISYVVHRYGPMIIMYDIRDRKKLEQNPHFTGISNKMFVESIEDIRKHI